jgi:hypothetical protein
MPFCSTVSPWEEDVLPMAPSGKLQTLEVARGGGGTAAPTIRNAP